jgi:hypothetical protein
MKILVAILVTALFSFVSIAYADDKDINASIERLASPNRPLNPKGEPFLVPTPPTYDEAAQEKIEEAVEELKKLGTAAFPYLIKHRNDKRYCRSYPTSIVRDFTVGETCMEILCSQVDSFDGRYEYKGMPSYSGSVIERDPKKWWKQHSSLTVTEMRIEALKWTINAEREEMTKRQEDFFRRMDMTRIKWEQECIAPLEKLLKAAESGPRE